MPREVAGAGITIELVGVPDWVVEAFRNAASDEPEATKAAQQRLEEQRGGVWTYSSETKTFEQRIAPPTIAPPIVHVPLVRAEHLASPREHRSRSRTRPASRGSPDDDPEPGRAGLPTFRVTSPAEFRRQLDAALGGMR